ncbi:hypothetical protein M422DRAFT_264655 [Sphaerobolus stellatus SS14]|uniref:Uncharacterized protein n=1 Tax=Sphaerobolus stellatus (strain SS14) TaxID=990650 RepID=A0A0C9V7T3_SPHS4|nr:hypothetical protein M422DRAFT_264655 [Sphaerobolus stellatus SS14]
MAPTLVPPPSVASNPSSTPSNAHLPSISLEFVLKDLNSLIHAIVLPKTRTAKICTISPDILHKARNLITSAVDAHKQQCSTTQITSIIEQLDAISNHISLSSKDAPFTTPTPPKPIHRDTRLHVMLLQVDCQNPVLRHYSNADLAWDISAACLNMGCVVRTIPDPTDPDEVQDIGPNIRAAGRHWSGDIWLQYATEEDRDFLIKNAPTWLPEFSPGLRLSIPTYPVVIHGFPTEFDPSRDSDDISNLLKCNEDIISHTSHLQHAEFISCKNLENIWSTKTHSSLILYFTDLTIANKCIEKQIVSDGNIAITVTAMAILPVTVTRPPHAASVLVHTTLKTVIANSHHVMVENHAGMSLLNVHYALEDMHQLALIVLNVKIC